MTTEYQEVVEGLRLIRDNPYKAEESERNHQIFARALLYLVERC